MINVTDNNKSIAEFMGGAYNKENDDFMFAPDNAPTKHASYLWDADCLLYHESWDWLMPVVEKIESIELWSDLGDDDKLPYRVEAQMYNNVCKIVPNTSCIVLNFQVYGKTKLQSTYDAVLQFITWYNKQS